MLVCGGTATAGGTAVTGLLLAARLATSHSRGLERGRTVARAGERKLHVRTVPSLTPVSPRPWYASRGFTTALVKASTSAAAFGFSAG